MSNEKFIFPLIDAETKVLENQMYIAGNPINLGLGFFLFVFLFFFLSPKQGFFLYTLDSYHNDVDICVVSVF